MRPHRIQMSLLGLFVLTAMAGLLLLAARKLLSMPREDAYWMMAAFFVGITLTAAAITAAQRSAYTKFMAGALIAIGAIPFGTYFGSYVVGLLSGLIGWWCGRTLVNELLALCGIVESRCPDDRIDGPAG